MLLSGIGLLFKPVSVYGKIWSGNKQAGSHKTLEDCLIPVKIKPQSDIFINPLNTYLWNPYFVHGPECQGSEPSAGTPLAVGLAGMWLYRNRWQDRLDEAHREEPPCDVLLGFLVDVSPVSHVCLL